MVICWLAINPIFRHHAIIDADVTWISENTLSYAIVPNDKGQTVLCQLLPMNIIGHDNTQANGPDVSLLEPAIILDLVSPPVLSRWEQITYFSLYINDFRLRGISNA